MITLEIMRGIAPRTRVNVLQDWIEPLEDVCEVYEINTPSRLACFLAQTAHESGGFNAIRENLNYSAQSLLRVFPKYFNAALAAKYDRKPEMIANRVYANRMGNGSEETGDGFKYRGRGLIQLTGKSNYTRFAADFGMELEEAVEYLETYDGAAMSAGWFWDANKLNDIADREDMLLLTKRINGGTIGLQDRIHHFELAKSLLS